MSYHFGLILPDFTVCSTTLSYFISCRIGFFLDRQTRQTRKLGTTKMGSIIERTPKDGSKSVYRPDRLQKRRCDRAPRSADLRPQTGCQCVGRQTRSRAQTARRTRPERRSASLRRDRPRGVENAVLGTKVQVLKTIRNSDLGEIRVTVLMTFCAQIRDKDRGDASRPRWILLVGRAGPSTLFAFNWLSVSGNGQEN